MVVAGRWWWGLTEKTYKHCSVAHFVRAWRVPPTYLPLPQSIHMPLLHASLFSYMHACHATTMAFLYCAFFHHLLFFPASIICIFMPYIPFIPSFLPSFLWFIPLVLVLVLVGWDGWICAWGGTLMEHSVPNLET